MYMKVVKTRITGTSKALTIPSEVEPAEYYTVDVNESGHLIYKPVKKDA